MGKKILIAGLVVASILLAYHGWKYFTKNKETKKAEEAKEETDGETFIDSIAESGEGAGSLARADTDTNLGQVAKGVPVS